MTVLLLPFQYVFLFFFFTYLIVVVRTSNTVLNKSGKTGLSCLVHDLRGKAFSMVSIVIAMDLQYQYMTFIMLRYIPFIPILLKVFDINVCLILSKVFSASIEMIICFLLLILLMWHITSVGLQILKQPLHHWDKFHLIMVYDPFNVLLNLMC